VVNFHKTEIEVDKRAFFIIPAKFFLRKWVIWLASWKIFDWFIITLIFLNSLSLAMVDYSDRDSERKWN